MVMYEQRDQHWDTFNHSNTPYAANGPFKAFVGWHGYFDKHGTVNWADKRSARSTEQGRHALNLPGRRIYKCGEIAECHSPISGKGKTPLKHDVCQLLTQPETSDIR